MDCCFWSICSGQLSGGQLQGLQGSQTVRDLISDFQRRLNFFTSFRFFSKFSET